MQQDHWEKVREREAVEAARKAKALKEADELYERLRKEIEQERRRCGAGRGGEGKRMREKNEKNEKI